jgi:hypothetical protein
VTAQCILLIHFLVSGWGAAFTAIQNERLPGSSAGKKKGCSEAALRVLPHYLAVEDVHRDFKAKAHFGVLGFGPHGEAPSRELSHTFRGYFSEISGRFLSYLETDCVTGTDATPTGKP